LVGVAVDVGGGETEEPASGIQQAVLPAIVLNQAIAMGAAIELEADPMGSVVQVGPADEAAPGVVKRDLYLGTWEPRQDQEHA